MNFKQKCFYMGLGCVFTLLGYTLATLNNDVTAQSESTVVDEIVCRRLRIVDHKKMTVAILGDYLNETLSIYSTEGRKVLEIGREKNGGYISVNHLDGARTLKMGIADNIEDKQGLISVEAKNGAGKIQLSTDANGGGLAIFNKDGQNVLQASVNNQGGGKIATKDPHSDK